MASLQSFAKGAVASAVGLSTLSLGLLYYGQNYLIYPAAFPPGSRTDADVQTPKDYDIPYDDLTLTTPDNVKIKAYLLRQRRRLPGVDDEDDNGIVESGEMESEDRALEDRKFASTRPTIMMFHGNGGNIGHRVPLARIFWQKMRCNVMLTSYRGYGQSEGSPSEQGFNIDSQTALDYVLQDETLKSTRVICYGQSIGGAVSISLAARNPDHIYALILENTFLSIPRLIPTALPWLSSLSWLCHQKWDSATVITKIPKTTPMLFLSGNKDEIVPSEQMQMLWNIAIGKNNPDGTLKSAASTSTATPKVTEDVKGLVDGSDLGVPTEVVDSKGSKVIDSGSNVPQAGSARSTVAQSTSSEEDPDTREYVEYDTIGEKEVLLSKRTTYRIWREFEKGTHNDTCIQPKYWSYIWQYVNQLCPLPTEHFKT